MNQAALMLNGKNTLVVKLAESAVELQQAKRLRYEVFVEEEGNKRLVNAERLEQDEYDEFCDHLIVMDVMEERVVGTYRLLPGERAVRNIGFYSETEFKLNNFQSYMRQSLELGRSCIAPDHRNGKAIQLLWEGIADYVTVHNYDYLIGCASIHVDQLLELNQIYTMLVEKQIITDKYGVHPLATHRIPGLMLLDNQEGDKRLFRKLPPLMKGYQWLGAEIGGEPAYDHIFGTIDFFIILEKSRLTSKYKKRFIKE